MKVTFRDPEPARDFGQHRSLPGVIPDRTGYHQVSASSGAGWTEGWHTHKRLRKPGINLILKSIDKSYHRCAGKIFDFNFLCIVVVQKS